jgi:glycosyltransferase involved in cell wall biosynthesis
MEIVHVVLGKANPNRMNGVNKVVYQLATQQRKAGYKVSVWGITTSLEHNYPERNFETRLFRAFRNRFRLDPLFTSALSECSKDVVFHLHGGFHPIFHTIGSMLRHSQVPYILTPHGAYNSIAMRKNRLVKMFYTSFFERRLVHEAAGIHCLGSSEMVGARSICPEARYVLIPYGYESPDVPPVVPDYHRFILGFCGRLDIYTKGLDAVVSGFSKIREQLPQAELWIIGDGNERQELERMVASGKLSGVTFWGSRYGKEKDELLRQMHVFLHPSRNEGLPSSVLEAASFGIPCVVTRATNVGESISSYHCGEVIADTDADQLTEAVMKVYQYIRTNGWMKISDAARTMVAEEFNWLSILGRFEKMYIDACLR